MNPSSQKTVEQRVDRLRALLVTADLGGMLIGEENNRRYISGFTGSTGWILITPSDAILITDGRYWERAAREAPSFTLMRVTQDYESAMREAFSLVSGRVGFEGDTITVNQFEQGLKPAQHITWVPADDLLRMLRMVKSDEEMAAIRRAAALTDETMRRVPEMLRPGLSEAELAWELEKYMREHGAEGLAFPIIVAFAENSALPHAEPGERRLEQNMAVCIDMGARVDGYCADLTRSFWYGPNPPEDYLRAWEAVHAALTAAVVSVHPGTSGRRVDAAARDMLGVYGLANAFLHSVGHGVGLAIHESPRLGRRASDALAARHVITVEPGVYLSGRWGIRLEELLIVWDNGPEVVSRAPLWRVVV